MARAREGAGTVTFGMIVFVGLWLTSTVFLVILYTGQEELETEMAQVRTENEMLISSQERRSIELVKSARAGGPTVVGLMEQARAETATLATGDPADDPATVRGKLEGLVTAIRDDGIVKDPASYEGASLHEALEKLYSRYRADSALREEIAKRATELEAEVTRLTELNAQLKNDFEERAAELNEQFAEAEAARESFRSERDKTLAELKEEYETITAQVNADLTQERQRHAACLEELEEAQERFRVLRRRLGDLTVGPDDLSTARQPDGKILTAVPGDEIVYIDLGRRDGLTLGLQFAVYSADTGIPADGRSKAQIEVVSINETSAGCRIVRQARDKVVLEGDLVANPIFDPSRPMRFVIIGEFDFDRDGMPDRDGRETIASLVRNWGAQVDEELTPLTDFLVVGVAPRKPRPETEVPADRVEINRSRRAAWEAYIGTVEAAQNLSIPTMTQEVFLNFLGYGNRYAVR